MQSRATFSQNVRAQRRRVVESLNSRVRAEVNLRFTKISPELLGSLQSVAIPCFGTRARCFSGDKSRAERNLAPRRRPRVCLTGALAWAHAHTLAVRREHSEQTPIFQFQIATLADLKRQDSTLSVPPHEPFSTSYCGERALGTDCP